MKHNTTITIHHSYKFTVTWDICVHSTGRTVHDPQKYTHNNITIHLGGGGRPGNEATYLDLTPVKTSSILPLKCFALGLTCPVLTCPVLTCPELTCKCEVLSKPLSHTHIWKYLPHYFRCPPPSPQHLAIKYTLKEMLGTYFIMFIR